MKPVPAVKVAAVLAIDKAAKKASVDVPAQVVEVDRLVLLAEPFAVHTPTLVVDAAVYSLTFNVATEVVVQVHVTVFAPLEVVLP